MFDFNLRKVIAVAVVNCFLFSFVWGNVLGEVISGVQDGTHYAQMLNNFTLPYSYGKITGANITNSPRLIIQIQDLHCHPGVQKNIAKIIELIDKKMPAGLANVYLEGAWGDVDTSWLEAAATKNSTYGAGTLDTILQTGRLTGAEYYSAASGKYNLIKGLESQKEYLENLKRFGGILQNQQEIEIVLNGISASTQNLKTKYFNPKQAKIENLHAEFAAGNISARKYYAHLLKYVHALGIDINKYENTLLYFSLTNAGRRLNYKAISAQMQQLLVELKEKLPYAVYKNIVDATGNFSQTDKLYGYLISLSRQYNIALQQYYPELNKFFAYIENSQKINPVELIDEEAALRNEINSRFALTKAEREVIFLTGFEKYLKDYLSSKITYKDYEYYKQNIEEYKKLWVKYVDNRVLELLTPYISQADEFYRVNTDRNQYFAHALGIRGKAAAVEENLNFPNPNVNLNEIVNVLDGKNVEVVVTGGFHTDGVSQILKDNGISYIVITPNAESGLKEAEEVYYKVVNLQSGNLTSTAPAFAAGNTFTSALINTIPPIPSTLYAPFRNAVTYGQDLSDINPAENPLRNENNIRISALTETAKLLEAGSTGEVLDELRDIINAKISDKNNNLSKDALNEIIAASPEGFDVLINALNTDGNVEEVLRSIDTQSQLTKVWIGKLLDFFGVKNFNTRQAIITSLEQFHILRGIFFKRSKESFIKAHAQGADIEQGIIEVENASLAALDEKLSSKLKKAVEEAGGNIYQLSLAKKIGFYIAMALSANVRKANRQKHKQVNTPVTPAGNKAVTADTVKVADKDITAGTEKASALEEKTLDAADSAYFHAASVMFVLGPKARRAYIEAVFNGNDEFLTPENMDIFPNYEGIEDADKRAVELKNYERRSLSTLQSLKNLIALYKETGLFDGISFENFLIAINERLAPAGINITKEYLLTAQNLNAISNIIVKGLSFENGNIVVPPVEDDSKMNLLDYKRVKHDITALVGDGSNGQLPMIFGPFFATPTVQKDAQAKIDADAQKIRNDALKFAAAHNDHVDAADSIYFHAASVMFVLGPKARRAYIEAVFNGNDEFLTSENMDIFQNYEGVKDDDKRAAELEKYKKRNLNVLQSLENLIALYKETGLFDGISFENFLIAINKRLAPAGINITEKYLLTEQNLNAISNIIVKGLSFENGNMVVPPVEDDSKMNSFNYKRLKHDITALVGDGNTGSLPRYFGPFLALPAVQKDAQAKIDAAAQKIINDALAFAAAHKGQAASGKAKAAAYAPQDDTRKLSITEGKNTSGISYKHAAFSGVLPTAVKERAKKMQANWRYYQEMTEANKAAVTNIGLGQIAEAALNTEDMLIATSNYEPEDSALAMLLLKYAQDDYAELAARDKDAATARHKAGPHKWNAEKMRQMGKALKEVNEILIKKAQANLDSWVDLTTSEHGRKVVAADKINFLRQGINDTYIIKKAQATIERKQKQKQLKRKLTDAEKVEVWLEASIETERFKQWREIVNFADVFMRGQGIDEDDTLINLHTIINYVHQDLGIAGFKSTSKEKDAEKNFPPDEVFYGNYSPAKIKTSIFPISLLPKLINSENEINVINCDYEEDLQGNTTLKPLDHKTKAFLADLVNIFNLSDNVEFYVNGRELLASIKLSKDVNSHSFDILIDLDNTEHTIIANFYDPASMQNSNRISRMGEELAKRGFGIAYTQTEYKDQSTGKIITVKDGIKITFDLSDEYTDKLVRQTGMLLNVMSIFNRNITDETALTQMYGDEIVDDTMQTGQLDMDYRLVAGLKMIDARVQASKARLAKIYKALKIPEGRRYPEEIVRYIAFGKASDVDYEKGTARINTKQSSYDEIISQRGEILNEMEYLRIKYRGNMRKPIYSAGYETYYDWFYGIHRSPGGQIVNEKSTTQLLDKIAKSSTFTELMEMKKCAHLIMQCHVKEFKGRVTHSIGGVDIREGYIQMKDGRLMRVYSFVETGRRITMLASFELFNPDTGQRRNIGYDEAKALLTDYLSTPEKPYDIPDIMDYYGTQEYIVKDTLHQCARVEWLSKMQPVVYPKNIIKIQGTTVAAGTGIKDGLITFDINDTDKSKILVLQDLPPDLVAAASKFAGIILITGHPNSHSGIAVKELEILTVISKGDSEFRTEQASNVATQKVFVMHYTQPTNKKVDYKYHKLNEVLDGEIILRAGTRVMLNGDTGEIFVVKGVGEVNIETLTESYVAEAISKIVSTELVPAKYTYARELAQKLGIGFTDESGVFRVYKKKYLEEIADSLEERGISDAKNIIDLLMNFLYEAEFDLRYLVRKRITEITPEDKKKHIPEGKLIKEISSMSTKEGALSDEENKRLLDIERRAVEISVWSNFYGNEDLGRDNFYDKKNIEKKLSDLDASVKGILNKRANAERQAYGGTDLNKEISRMIKTSSELGIGSEKVFGNKNKGAAWLSKNMTELAKNVNDNEELGGKKIEITAPKSMHLGNDLFEFVTKKLKGKFEESYSDMVEEYKALKVQIIAAKKTGATDVMEDVEKLVNLGKRIQKTVANFGSPMPLAEEYGTPEEIRAAQEANHEVALIIAEIQLAIILALNLEDDKLYTSRSSGVGEDGTNTALAGVADSYGPIALEHGTAAEIKKIAMYQAQNGHIRRKQDMEFINEIWAKLQISDVCASFFGERSTRYALEHNLPGIIEPAVLFQEFVPNVVAAGVVLNNVITVAPGLGENTVGGTAEVDTYTRRDGGIIPTKGIEGKEVINNTQQRALLSLSRELERAYGAAVDIEFAVDAKGNIHIVQIRFVTDLVKKDWNINYNISLEEFANNSTLEESELSPDEVVEIKAMLETQKAHVAALSATLNTSASEAFKNASPAMPVKTARDAALDLVTSEKDKHEISSGVSLSGNLVLVESADDMQKLSEQGFSAVLISTISAQEGKAISNISDERLYITDGQEIGKAYIDLANNSVKVVLYEGYTLSDAAAALHKLVTDGKIAGKGIENELPEIKNVILAADAGSTEVIDSIRNVDTARNGRNTIFNLSTLRSGINLKSDCDRVSNLEDVRAFVISFEQYEANKAYIETARQTAGRQFILATTAYEFLNSTAEEKKKFDGFQIDAKNMSLKGAREILAKISDANTLSSLSRISIKFHEDVFALIGEDVLKTYGVMPIVNIDSEYKYSAEFRIKSEEEYVKALSDKRYKASNTDNTNVLSAGKTQSTELAATVAYDKGYTAGLSSKFDYSLKTENMSEENLEDLFAAMDVDTATEANINGVKNFLSAEALAYVEFLLESSQKTKLAEISGFVRAAVMNSAREEILTAFGGAVNKTKLLDSVMFQKEYLTLAVKLKLAGKNLTELALDKFEVSDDVSAKEALDNIAQSLKADVKELLSEDDYKIARVTPEQMPLTIDAFKKFNIVLNDNFRKDINPVENIKAASTLAMKHILASA